MKKLFFLLSVLSISTSSFAISDEYLAKFCLEVGKEKIQYQANAYGCQVDLNETYVSDIDNRWYNPSKYIWYAVKEECHDRDRVGVTVQYYNGKCF